MSVFISYAHKDAPFVEELCHELIKKKIYIWFDKWELNVGDSITSKVQSALTEASYLCVVLSKDSVNSDWCKRELNAGLFREIEEKRVVVLPILIEDCEIPLFLRDKLYADFRNDFTIGLQAVVTALSKLNSEKLGRIDKGDYVTDMAMRWGERKNLFEFHLDLVSFKKGEAWSVLTTATLVGNPIISNAFKLSHRAGKGEVIVREVIRYLIKDKEIANTRILIHNDFPVEKNFKIITEGGHCLSVQSLTRRMGEDSGRDILYDLGQTIVDVFSLKVIEGENG